MILDQDLQVWAAHQVRVRPEGMDYREVQGKALAVQKDLDKIIRSLRDSYFLFNVHANPMRVVTDAQPNEIEKLELIAKAARLVEYFKRQKTSHAI